jgi:hypothetical protein
VLATLTRIWPWTISKTNTNKLAPDWCELVTEFGDSNLEILSGDLLGVVFRITRVEVIPTVDDGVQFIFNYELIHTGDIPVEALTSEQNKNIIISVIREYLELK